MGTHTPSRWRRHPEAVAEGSAPLAVGKVDGPDRAGLAHAREHDLHDTARLIYECRERLPPYAAFGPSLLDGHPRAYGLIKRALNIIYWLLSFLSSPILRPLLRPR